MGKRSDGAFERRERDFYKTPREAVAPILPHLMPGTRFFEPCAGDGALIDHLVGAGHECIGSSDIEPQRAGISRGDALESSFALPVGGVFITNPPWDRKILHPLIEHLSDIAPTWLLFDADWMHTRQSSKFMPRLCRIVSIGRVKWIENTKMAGKDNSAWYLFDRLNNSAPEFYGR